jgi:hypothetical protein
MRPNDQKSLQVHGKCVRKMFLKKNPESEVQVIEDLSKIRELLHSWQERIIRPEYVFMSPVEEGDVLMWDNWSIFHSAVDYPEHYGPRSKFKFKECMLTHLTEYSYAPSQSWCLRLSCGTHAYPSMIVSHGREELTRPVESKLERCILCIRES